MQLPMRFILRNSVTSPYFQEFMVECHSSHILEFWHLIDHFPSNCHSKLTMAAQQGNTVSVEAMQAVYKRLTQDALRLFYQVRRAQRVPLSMALAHLLRRSAFSLHSALCLLRLSEVRCRRSANQGGAAAGNFGRNLQLCHNEAAPAPHDV